MLLSELNEKIIVVCHTEAEWTKVCELLAAHRFIAMGGWRGRFEHGNYILVYPDKEFLCIHTNHTAVSQIRNIPAAALLITENEAPNKYGDDDYAVPEDLKTLKND